MTTATTVLGLLPLALGLGSGSEIQAPLARVVVGGLTASTLVTLVLIPSAYVAVARRASRVKPDPYVWEAPRPGAEEDQIAAG
jgi:HAE1 family hydrophobic/amphiphilic exporter-1